MNLSYGSRSMHFDMDDHWHKVERIVSKFRYKPGWKLYARNSFDVVSFHADVTNYFVPHPDINIVNTGADFTVAFRIDMGHICFADDLEGQTLNCLRILIRHAELHEMDEWCAYKGERRWNPHAPDYTKEI